MFCPSCGKTNATDQKFCRSCGLSLEATLVSLGEQARGRNDIGERSGNRDVAGEILVWLCGAMLAAFVTIMIYTIVTKIIIAKGDVWSGIGFIAFILAAVTAILLVIYRESRLEAEAKSPNRSTPIVNAFDDQPRLTDGGFENVASVTEETTSRLKIERD